MANQALTLATEPPIQAAGTSQAATSQLMENPAYTRQQLINYIGNKRGLSAPIDDAVMEVRQRLGGRKLRSMDLFSGSGFVSRLLKKHSNLVAANDLETYAHAISSCYLPDHSQQLSEKAALLVNELNNAVACGATRNGFVSQLYSPIDDQNIRPGERVFYSNDNARRLDFYAQELQEVAPEIKRVLMGPLLAKASAHVNTGGVFKGFYKDKYTGVGKFGAAGGDSLKRILAPITLELPVTSNFSSAFEVYQQDANTLASELSGFDLVYIDPPYNQHPYGSNYFMLNLLVNYTAPSEISQVSGIPTNWNRSGYNVKRQALDLLVELFAKIPARFLLVSFNSEGYVSTPEIKQALGEHGSVDEMVIQYNTYRASRNLSGRPVHVNEHLFLLDRQAN